MYKSLQFINTLTPKQIGRDFAGGISKCIFLKDNIEISIKISPKFVPKCLFDNIPAMAWRRQTIIWINDG